MGDKVKNLHIRLTKVEDELLEDAEEITGSDRSKLVRDAIWGHVLPIVSRRRDMLRKVDDDGLV